MDNVRVSVAVGQIRATWQHFSLLNQEWNVDLREKVYHQPSGRLLQIETTQPGVQFYTANFLDGSLKGKGGAMYPKHSAFCLETQNWPDAVNKMNFPDALLRPGEEYDHTTWFKFSVL
ncbi:hypothetical protein scyTo_0024523 [Scyliorhinus torazame]|uniref:Galactose mutarotase n=1 Tax=Scyliorhinus torazame TaxID=75743 RepID=A0A401QF37_SCYTO|nr:hypothetical protein [Scyliorhinus torazame]